VLNHFTGGACGADRKTLEDSSVSERQDGWNAGPEKRRQGQLLILLPPRLDDRKTFAHQTDLREHPDSFGTGAWLGLSGTRKRNG
jgi:hypothetical protein